MKKQTNLKIAETRISYQMMSTPEGVIPDAWIVFEREGKKLPLFLEIDRGTEYQQKFKQHVRSRIDFIRSGTYSKLFGTPAVLIAYVTTGERPEYRETRVATMRKWTQEVLGELGLEKWAGTFRFAAFPLSEFYKQAGALFEGKVWLRPDLGEPGPLF